MRKYLLATILALTSSLASAANFDVVVVGGSPSAVAAAVTVADRGRNVALISQTQTVGGTISNGLGASDIGSTTAVTGFQARFFNAVKALYSDPDTWRVAPSDAESIFSDFLSDAGVSVFTEVQLSGVSRDGATIDCVDTSAGEFCARTFVDATYAGDLAALAGAPYRLGYADFYAYGEPYTLDRQFTLHGQLSATNTSGALAAFNANPFIATGPRDPYPLVSDEAMPSMTFRLCVTRQASNRAAFGQSQNYETYANSWRRWVPAYFSSGGGNVSITSLGTINSAAYQIAKTTATKWDMNSGFGSFMNVPIPPDYFSGGRQAVISQMAEYHRDWLHFLQNDTAVPSAIRTNFSDFGLCADEFTDNGNWPYEPYVREGRRIIGRDLLSTENIYLKDRRVATESVAVGTYNLDSKLSIIFYDRGRIWRDTSGHLTTPWYEIPRGVMHPVGIDNLIVSVAISATPRAYGSVRMEPQFMALGEAAGAIAYVAHLHQSSAVSVPYSSVRYILNQNGAQVKIAPLCQTIGAQFRGSVGFNSSTCAPIDYTPATGI